MLRVWPHGDTAWRYGARPRATARWAVSPLTRVHRVIEPFWLNHAVQKRRIRDSNPCPQRRMCRSLFAGNSMS